MFIGDRFHLFFFKSSVRHQSNAIFIFRCLKMTLPTPPAPPLPPPEKNQSWRIRETPSFSHAAIPYSLCRPVQESSAPPEALHGDPAISLTAAGESDPQLTSSEGHEDEHHHSLETTGPVPETKPAPQTQVRSEEEDESG